jgi:hypothetical protein
VVRIFLAYGHGLGSSGSQALSAIVGNRAVYNGAAIEAFPGIEHEKEIREPLQHHHSLTLRTIHRSLPMVITYTAAYVLKQDPRQTDMC